MITSETILDSDHSIARTMPEVKTYGILVYGGPDGYQTNRAQIQLMGVDSNVIAFLRFNDPGMIFENDYLPVDGIIRMHLPSSMFQSILDMLRNEKPIYCYFAAGRGFLANFEEPVGEGES
jgi:hypothetical protein